jgi:glycosyltransferase involved in cell wall biosynthesis
MCRVSVVMPAYNAASTVESAMRSVLAQTFGALELIVIEDGSSDGTAAVVERVAGEDERVRVLRNERNLGLIRSIQRGLEAARGEYVARMDADDLCAPERIERQVAFLEAHPGIAVVGSRYRLFSESPADARVDPAHDAFYTADGIRRGRTPVPHPTACFRAALIARYGTYDPAWANAEDHELWARWYAQGARFAVLPERLLDYRVHAASVTASKSRAVVAMSLRVNLRAIVRYRIRMLPAGYLYMAKQAAFLATSPLTARFVGRGRDQARTR